MTPTPFMRRVGSTNSSQLGGGDIFNMLSASDGVAPKSLELQAMQLLLVCRSVLVEVGLPLRSKWFGPTTEETRGSPCKGASWRAAVEAVGAQGNEGEVAGEGAGVGFQ